MILKKENDYRFEGIFVPIFNKIPQVARILSRQSSARSGEKVGTSTLGLVLMPRRKEALMVTLCKD